MTETVSAGAPAGQLPRPRGPLSADVLELLQHEPGCPVPEPPSDLDPYGDDLHLTLYTCYELHYHGFDGVDPEWEWDPTLLGLRARLERRFLEQLRGDVVGGDDVDAELDALLRPPKETEAGPDLARYLRDDGQWWQVQEYLVHRSIYHHKEADPNAWLIPRLRGQAKASLVAVEFDEFGGGRGERVHARLYADLLTGAGLHDGYLHYLDVVPAPMLALVDMMSLFGLHRNLRGAAIGHFAAVEISSSPASSRLADMLRGFEAHPACQFFYTEHVEADAVHEQVLRRDVIGDMLAHEPELAASMVFGIQATGLLESRFTDYVLDHWTHSNSSLREGIR